LVNHAGNVCFEGEKVGVRVTCDNEKGTIDIKKIVVGLVQYIFVSSNNGADFTYKQTVAKQ
jgi:hypothetical protein